jgi:hypothetical protein
VPVIREITPEAGQLWLSRPPYCMLARVRAVDLDAYPAVIEYQLLDDDGVPLTARISTQLDSRWWSYFQPLVRRQG